MNTENTTMTQAHQQLCECVTTCGDCRKPSEKCGGYKVDLEAHPDDAAVDALAALMKDKLAKQRDKGYGGWNDKAQCSQQRLSDMLRAHVDKGDPVDVANFCAFLVARGEGIAAAPQAVQAAVPVGGQSRFKGEKDWQWCSPEHVAMVLATPSEWQGYEVRYLYAAPAHPAEGVPAQAATLPPLPEPTAFLVCKGSEVTARAWDVDQMRAYAADAIAATQPAAQGLDAQMLNFINDKRIALTPEYEGPWKAEVFGDEAEPVITTEGNTVRDAVSAAIAAQAKQGGA